MIFTQGSTVENLKAMAIGNPLKHPHSFPDRLGDHRLVALLTIVDLLDPHPEVFQERHVTFQSG